MIEDFAKESVSKWFEEQGVALNTEELSDVMEILMHTFELVKKNRPKLQMKDDVAQAAVNLLLSSTLNAVRILRSTL